MVRGKNVYKKLIEIHASKHKFFRESFEVVIDVISLLEEHSLEEKVAVVVRVKLLYDSAALAM